MNKLMGLILTYLIIYIQHNIYTYTYVHIYAHMYSMFFSIYHSPHWIAHTSLYAQIDPVSAYIFYIFHYALIDLLSSILCSLLSSFPLLFIHTNTHTYTITLKHRTTLSGSNTKNWLHKNTMSTSKTKGFKGHLLNSQLCMKIAWKHRFYFPHVPCSTVVIVGCFCSSKTKTVTNKVTF